VKAHQAQAVNIGDDATVGNVTQNQDIRNYFGALAGSTGQAAVAVLEGPLTPEQRQLVERADELEASGAPSDAADILLELQRDLAVDGLPDVGERLRRRAAAVLAHSDDPAVRAMGGDLYLDLAQSALERQDPDLGFLASRAIDLAPPGRKWIGHGLLARHQIVAGEPGWMDALQQAAGEARERGADELPWVAAVVEELLLDGRVEEARTTAEAARDAAPLSRGPRLALELDYLDACQSLGEDVELELTRSR
jgi:hypothetical protein